MYGITEMLVNANIMEFNKLCLCNLISIVLHMDDNNVIKDWFYHDYSM